MNEYYIYRIVNTINNHDYIGKKKARTIDPLLDNYFGSGTLIKKAINRYGIQNFKKEILERGLTLEEAFIREVYWISKYKKEGKAYYNISPGLEGFNNKDSIDKETLLEYNKHISNKVKDNWSLLSDKDYETRTFLMKEGWNKRSTKEKESFSQIRSSVQKEVYKNTSETKKASINEKRKESLREMHKNRTFEQKEEINNKISQKLKNYNSSLTIEQKTKISENLSKAQKEYLKRETKEHRQQRSLNQSLSQGKYYKLKDPKGNEFIIKSLNLWCKHTFGDKYNSAGVTLRKSKKYKGYRIIKEIDPSEIDNSVTFNDYLRDESRVQVDSKSQLP